MKTGRQLLGEQLKAIRKNAGLSISALATNTESSRAYISAVEQGRKNISIDTFEKLLRGCGKSMEGWIAAFDRSTTPRRHPKLYEMLSTIVEINDPDLIFGIQINLEAISEKAERKARDKPSPSSGEAGRHKKTNRHAS